MIIAPSKLQPRGASKHVTAVLEDLGIFKKVESLDEIHLHIEKEPYIDLVIEKHRDELSFAHYREQNGDLINDGELVFTIDRAGILCLKETVTGGPYGPVNGGSDKEFARIFAKNIVEHGFGKGKVVWFTPKDSGFSDGLDTTNDACKSAEIPSVSFEPDPDIEIIFSVDPKVVFNSNYLEKIEIKPDLDKVISGRILYETKEKDLTDAIWLLKDGSIPEPLSVAVESKKELGEVINQHSSQRLWEMIAGDGVELEFVFAVNNFFGPLNGITALVFDTGNGLVAFNGDILAWMLSCLPDMQFVYHCKPADFGVIVTPQGNVGLLKPLKPGVLDDLARMKVVKRVPVEKKVEELPICDSCQEESTRVNDQLINNNQDVIPQFLTCFERLSYYCDVKKDRSRDKMGVVKEMADCTVTLMDGTVLRKTPDGQQKVSELVQVGDIVRVAGEVRRPGDALSEYQPPKTDIFRVEGIHHSQSPAEDRYTLTEWECFSLHLSLLEDQNKNGKLPRGYVPYSATELVAVDGRIFKLFMANTDEVFVVEKAKTRLENIDPALADRTWTLKELFGIIDDNVLDGKKLSKKDSSALIRDIGKAKGIKDAEKLVFRNLINGIYAAQHGYMQDEPREILESPKIDRLDARMASLTQEQYLIQDETCRKAETYFMKAEDNDFYIKRFHKDSPTHNKKAKERLFMAVQRLDRVKSEAKSMHMKLVELAINAGVFLPIEALETSLKSPLIEAELKRRSSMAITLQSDVSQQERNIETPEVQQSAQPVQIMEEVPEEIPVSFKEEVLIINELSNDPDTDTLPEIRFTLDSRIDDISRSVDVIESRVQEVQEKYRSLIEDLQGKLQGLSASNAFHIAVTSQISVFEGMAGNFRKECMAQFEQAKTALSFDVTDELRKAFKPDQIETITEDVMGRIFGHDDNGKGDNVDFTMTVKDVIASGIEKHAPENPVQPKVKEPWEMFFAEWSELLHAARSMPVNGSKSGTLIKVQALEKIRYGISDQFFDEEQKSFWPKPWMKLYSEIIHKAVSDGKPVTQKVIIQLKEIEAELDRKTEKPQDAMRDISAMDISGSVTQETTISGAKFMPGDRVKIISKLAHIVDQEGVIVFHELNGKDINYVVRLDAGPLQDPFEGVKYDPSVPELDLVLICATAREQQAQIEEEIPDMVYNNETGLKEGDRVQIISGQYVGRHGAVVMVRESPVSDATKPREFLFSVKTDNGISVTLFPWAFEIETGKQPDVIMDIEAPEGFVEPELLYIDLLELSKKVEQYRTKAGMETDTQKKSEIEQLIQVVMIKGKERKSLFVQWAAKYPVLAKGIIEKNKRTAAVTGSIGNVSQPKQPAQQSHQTSTPNSRPQSDTSMQRPFTGGYTRRNQSHRR